uniref:Crinkler effector protein N-terminal domain-containing protein n=1 Tax=Rhizophagus irregularis (strain DAOM 181602 / DAOM 197198 / MUCL 43194) TaxID=747089 RepID=U9UJ03_RHIID
MTTSNSNNILSLNCIIPGDEFEDIFTLEISEDKLVNQLKPMIRKWWPNRFQHIDPSKLILYKVIDANIALGFSEILKKKKEEGDKNYGQRLPPLKNICIHFNNDQETYPDSIKPKENRVSIVVCPPEDR